MHSQVKFKFSIGSYNGTMGMKISYKDRVLLSRDSFDEDTFTLEATIDLPGTVCIDLYGKGPNDTQIDEQGNVLKDKYIKLEELTVDRMPVHILSLIKLPELHANNQVTRINYWGFNGQARINFEQSDPFRWHLDAMREKANDWTKNKLT